MTSLKYHEVKRGLRFTKYLDDQQNFDDSLELIEEDEHSIPVSE